MGKKGSLFEHAKKVGSTKILCLGKKGSPFEDAEKAGLTAKLV